MPMPLTFGFKQLSLATTELETQTSSKPFTFGRDASGNAAIAAASTVEHAFSASKKPGRKKALTKHGRNKKLTSCVNPSFGERQSASELNFAQVKVLN